MFLNSKTFLKDSSQECWSLTAFMAGVQTYSEEASKWISAWGKTLMEETDTNIINTKKII